MNKSKDLREALDHLTDLTLYKIRTNNYKMNDSCTLMNIDQDGIKIERAIEKIKNAINDREDLKKELYDARDYLELCKTMNMKTVKIIDTKGWSLYATKRSAAFDLRSTERKVILPYQRILISTGVFISEMDRDLQGFITSKSGLAIHNGITVFNSPGIIDSDYKDEIYVILYNSSIEAYTVTVGQSIAQMTFVPVFFAERISWTVDKNKNSQMEIQSMLSDEERKGGFGSTGL
ncbi:deoxyuridine 5'-triphosphate nucleotidohydrolase-like [Hydra vulgaris]|uniref:deoxyuridine 5'-triphosphate nucleotidohydrolase-like n=1 Tax=Hydra vulgaris TaxID=6087 RepID=UPI0032E9F5FE